MCSHSVYSVTAVKLRHRPVAISGQVLTRLAEEIKSWINLSFMFGTSFVQFRPGETSEYGNLKLN